MRVMTKMNRHPFLAIDPRGEPESELHTKLEHWVELYRSVR
jgi:hypothetical protein